MVLAQKAAHREAAAFVDNLSRVSWLGFECSLAVNQFFSILNV